MLHQSIKSVFHYGNNSLRPYFLKEYPVGTTSGLPRPEALASGSSAFAQRTQWIHWCIHNPFLL
jgi:hypothetical protein